ncbi:Protease 3 [Pseudidiomarina piscicola]|uniref:Protease 3 n=1 Tax=Pseudidiomarina piscicola TaxID=2614830 RepID=A0A6S6WKU2_9GAMM|nr:insulinase family protein [Pseudidiomarina piscicola]CAB0149569.1 Protease 3 [Pseudidiomarina piscicola]VZT39018.1 Protease 3 [Pseudomonas aeruginosa]
MEPSNSLDRYTDSIQSPTDHRDYAMVTLANGLQCTLVHDAKTPQSTAALAVAAGHFQDPKDYQGLAHFLEHMLFLGTQGYPSATAYQDFIHQHGGQHNAWTGTEFSSYYFNCDSDAFSDALDRFARFFYQPTFNPEWITKEVQSIEAEFQLKKKDELRRLYQVHKATSNPAHPFHKFSVGNLATLTDNGDTHALKAKVEHFFDHWYRANRMTLVVAGPQSLAELEALATEHFSAIRGKGPAVTGETEPLYLPEQLGIQLNVRPVKDARRLILAFALPGIDDDYAYKTTSFIAHLLGYEGPGSLFAELHRRNLVNSLAAGGGISGSNFKDFNINMQLTDEGMAATDLIIEQVFATLRLIEQQGLEAWRYHERQVAIANAFRFQEPARTADLAAQLAINMHHYSKHDLIFGDYRMDQLNLTKARQLLGAMVPTNMRATHIHRQVEVDTHEPIYGTDYQLKALTDAQITQWSQPGEAWATLPAANPYLKPVAAPLALAEPRSSTPNFYKVSEGLSHWHLQDPDFRAPKAHVYCQFVLPQATRSAQHYACARLWCELMIDRFNEECYDAEIAGLHFNIYPQHYGITLHVSGYSAGIAELTATLLKRFIAPKFSTARWHDIHQKLQSNWQSALANRPLNLLFARLNVLLQPHMYALSDLAASLSKVDHQAFEQWHQQLFGEAEIRLFTHGDLTLERVAPILESAQGLFQLSDDLQAQVPPTHAVAELKRNGKFEQRGQLRTLHDDHAALLVIQGHSTAILEQATVLLLNQFIQPHLFNQLRTHQQLGYVVGSTYMPIEQRPHLLLYVQSSSYNADILSARIDAFTHAFVEQLEELGAQELDAIRGFLVQKLRAPDTNLRLRSQRLWTCIAQHDVNFERLEFIAQALENHTTEFFIQRIRQLLLAADDQGFITATPQGL